MFHDFYIFVIQWKAKLGQFVWHKPKNWGGLFYSGTSFNKHPKGFSHSWQMFKFIHMIFHTILRKKNINLSRVINKSFFCEFMNIYRMIRGIPIWRMFCSRIKEKKDRWQEWYKNNDDCTKNSNALGGLV